jgi:hypothetical protein
MKTNIIVFVILAIIFSCSAQKDFVKIKYQNNFLTNSKSKPFKKKVFVLKIPNKFAIIKEDYNPEYKEVVYKYSDSSIIYITDNNLSGSSLNGSNKLSIGIEIISKKLNDTIELSGKQKDNKCWKESFFDEIVIGYLNVPENKKVEFDKAIASIIRR